jgi:pyruvate ferredoxin oxidoreductase gamma subunit
VNSGLKKDGFLVTNTRYTGKEIRNVLGIQQALATVNATQIAREELRLPITNTTMLGALLKANPILPVESLVEPLKNRFGRIAEKNIRAFQRAYEETSVIPKEE